MNKNEIVREKQAFDHVHRGYRFVATYLAIPKGEALIEISKDGFVVREFLWPAYKIWNIPAHADDIVDGLEQHNSDGLYAAGSTGFGGNVYLDELPSPGAVDPVEGSGQEGPRASKDSSL